MQARREQDPKVPSWAVQVRPRLHPCPAPPSLYTLPGIACSTDTKNPQAHAQRLSLYFRPQEEAGTAGSAGGAGAGKEEAPPARTVRAFADPEPDRGRVPAAEGPPRPAPPKPSRSHLYAQHRCRRRSRRGPPYPPFSLTSASALAGNCSTTVFTARNQRNATVSQRFSKRLLSSCDLIFASSTNLYARGLLGVHMVTNPALCICSHWRGFSPGAGPSGSEWMEWVVLDTLPRGSWTVLKLPGVGPDVLCLILTRGS